MKCAIAVDCAVCKTLDTHSVLAGTIKPYSRHLFISHSYPWPSNINTLQDSIIPHLTSNFPTTSTEKTIISAFTPNVNTLSPSKILEFPQFLSYDIPPSDQFQNTISLIKSNSGSKILSLAHIFICIHKDRDARCGHIGPMLLDAFNSHIKSLNLQDQIFVYGVSHVGGHAYAGNVIIYHQKPELNGHWYGRVKPSDAQRIISDHVIGGSIIHELWRGCMNNELSSKISADIKSK